MPIPAERLGCCGRQFLGPSVPPETIALRRSGARHWAYREAAEAPTSLTLRERFCVERSVAPATKSQPFTIPWGNPREAKPNPKARSLPAWSAPSPEGMIAVPCWKFRAPSIESEHEDDSLGSLLYADPSYDFRSGFSDGMNGNLRLEFIEELEIRPTCASLLDSYGPLKSLSMRSSLGVKRPIRLLRRKTPRLISIHPI